LLRSVKISKDYAQALETLFSIKDDLVKSSLTSFLKKNKEKIDKIL
jgi:Na+/phosphate symporter